MNRLSKEKIAPGNEREEKVEGKCEVSPACEARRLMTHAAKVWKRGGTRSECGLQTNGLTFPESLLECRPRPPPGPTEPESAFSEALRAVHRHIRD